MNIQLQLHQIQEVTTLRKFFEFFKVDLVLDVGANTGQYAEMLRTKVGFQGKIISYEPFSTAFIELKEKTLHEELMEGYEEEKKSYEDKGEI